ncbi:hypothetical protein CP557_20085 [Natrinema ejinorense]|uniref:Uncharacterized protein n=1 Tax=Natrinema ejinorense TaxID=373386 RepID=A0A2A5QPL3_9EURY|nr:hypothetical protein CP557_20085 [Natrinema ejinorense]
MVTILIKKANDRKEKRYRDDQEPVLVEGSEADEYQPEEGITGELARVWAEGDTEGRKDLVEELVEKGEK